MFEYVRIVKGPVFQCEQDKAGQIEENEADGESVILLVVIISPVIIIVGRLR